MRQPRSIANSPPSSVENVTDPVPQKKIKGFADCLTCSYRAGMIEFTPYLALAQCSKEFGRRR